MTVTQRVANRGNVHAQCSGASSCNVQGGVNIIERDWGDPSGFFIITQRLLDHEGPRALALDDYDVHYSTVFGSGAGRITPGFLRPGRGTAGL